MLHKINQLKELIQNSKNIILFSHIRMDPDTFWSSWTLYLILTQLWKNVILLNDEEAPKEFEFLKANNLITTNWNLEDFQPDLIISLDAASIDQLWNSYKNNEKIIKNTSFVVIDHHISNNWFGNINIISPTHSSTCELLFEILEKLDLTKYIDKKIANLLITWILTDTNVFYNTNVTANTHKIAAKLLELWADSRTSIFNFFKKKSINKTKLLWLALSNIQIIKNKLENKKNIVYTIITAEDFKKTNSSDRDTNWIIEHLVNIENTEIAFIIYPLLDWKIKASFRSWSYDVSKLAQKLGWGWHKQASWASSEESIEKFLKKILTNI